MCSGIYVTENEMKVKEKKRKPGDKLPKKGINPYKGLYAYEEADKDIFRGREEEALKLSQLVKFNFLTVVFGKAGFGKTSLLNAGVFPLLGEEFLPIRVRLNYSATAPSLPEQIRLALQREIQKKGTRVKVKRNEEGDNGTAAVMAPGETLWEYFHKFSHFDTSRGIMVTPVLLLDQFEELFTLGKLHRGRKELIDELYWLIENQFPDAVRERILKKNEKENGFSYSRVRPKVRVIISLREDYLPHLNSLKSRIPSIDRVMCQVIHLNGIQAREVIGMPGGIQDEKIANDILRLFYPGEAKKEEKIKEEELEIEPSLLSLLCFQLFERKGVKAITKRDQNRILEDFYRSVLKNFPGKLERFIESELLTEEGLRIAHPFPHRHKFKEHLDELVERRVLRKVYYGEREHIEIIHDVLAPVIYKRKERREKRKKNVIIAGLSFVLIIFFFLTLYAFIQKTIAEKEARRAKSNERAVHSHLVLDKDPTLSFRLAEQAYRTDETNPNAYKTLLNTYYHDGEFYSAVLRHKDNVHYAAFSPDSKNIITAGRDGTAKLWTLKGKKIRTFRHKGPVKSAVFSPDGNQIVTASGDRTVTIWNREGKQLLEFETENYIELAFFSTDGNSIITMDRDKKIIQSWTLKGEFIRTYTGDERKDLEFEHLSTNGKTRIRPGRNNTAELLGESRNVLRVFKGHGKDVNSSVFSPDGNYIVTASNDHTARLWKLTPIEKARKFPQHTSQRFDFFAVISADGRYILTADSTKIILWDLSGNSSEEIPTGPVSDPIAAFSPNGKYIAITGSEAKNVQLRGMDRHLIREFNGHAEGAKWMVFSPDSKYIIAAGSDKTARLWDTNGNEIREFKHSESVNCASFSPDGELIITGSDDNTARLWDLEGNEKRKFPGHKKGVSSAVFSPDGKSILTCSSDETAVLWNLKGEPVTVFKMHQRAINSAQFSADGKYIVTVNSDRTVRLWDLSGRQIFEFRIEFKEEFKADGDVIHSASFSPDGAYILIVPAHGPAQLHLINPGEIISRVNRGGVWQLDEETKKKYNF